jgi:hypothetical protein
MMTLFDSKQKIEDICIVMLCRDSLSYLEEIEKSFVLLEKSYQVNFSYLFLENGSHDETSAFIQSFLSKRKGELIHPDPSIPLDSLKRTEKMAYLRNLTKEKSPANHPWFMLIDTDIYFNSDILKIMFGHLSNNNEIGMLCANGLEVIKKKGLRKYKKRYRGFKQEIITDSHQTFLTQYHYYDTYAYRDLQGKNYWPNCTYSACEKCIDTEKSGTHQKLKFVTSAFGGIALIKAELMSNSSMLWSGHDGANVEQCEHVEFCKSINEKSAYKVAIAEDAPSYWVIP